MSDKYIIRFVRHAGDDGPLSTEALQAELRDGESPGVAIHFENEPSFDDDKYDSQQYQIRYLNRAASEPTLFVASFTHYPKREKYIGQSDGSREILVFDMDDAIVDRANVDSSKGAVPEFEEQYPDDERYKFVKFVGVSEWKQVTQETLYSTDLCRNPRILQKEMIVPYWGDKPVRSNSVGQPNLVESIGWPIYYLSIFRHLFGV